MVTATEGLFTWRWGTPGRWGNSLRWGNPTVHIISHFNLLISFTWWGGGGGDPLRRAARSKRSGYPLSRGQIFPCKRFKVGWPAWPGLDSWYIKFAQNSLWRWLGIIIKVNNRKPSHWRLQQEHTRECRSALKTRKKRGLPAFSLFKCLATIQ